MTYPINNRGLDVAGYEIEERNNIKKIPLFKDINIQYNKLNSDIPFADNVFNSVLSCGTLEHEPDLNESLKEINRVLRGGGYFFI